MHYVQSEVSLMRIAVFCRVGRTGAGCGVFAIANIKTINQATNCRNINFYSFCQRFEAFSLFVFAHIVQ